MIKIKIITKVIFNYNSNYNNCYCDNNNINNLVLIVCVTFVTIDIVIAVTIVYDSTINILVVIFCRIRGDILARSSSPILKNILIHYGKNS